MQLSLLEYFPDTEKRVFLDVFACLKVEEGTKKMFLYPMEGQSVPLSIKVRCNREVINAFPPGTVYKLDVRLVLQKNRKPYFSAMSNKKIFRAIEFFDHNLSLQKGRVRKKVSRVQFERNRSDITT